MSRRKDIWNNPLLTRLSAEFMSYTYLLTAVNICSGKNALLKAGAIERYHRSHYYWTDLRKIADIFKQMTSFLSSQSFYRCFSRQLPPVLGQSF